MNRKTYRRGVLGTLAQIALLLVALTPNSVAQAAQEEPAGIPKTSKQHLVEAYGKIPLSFEANQGQTDSRVKFLAHGQGYTLFLTRGGEALLALRRPALKRDSLHPAANKPAAEPESETVTPSAVIRMSLAGANRTPQLEGANELPGKANYIIGNDPKKWRTNVPLFTKVNYRDVYPGVDLVYYGNQKQLEHDFVVAPGADPASITMAVQGAERVSLDAQGDLVLAMKNGKVRLQKPVVYQEVDGVRREIPSSYRLTGAHQFSF